MFGTVAVALGLVTASALAAPAAVKAPLVCSRGPSGTSFEAVVTEPFSQAAGTSYTVRIDSKASGTIQHGGLNYIYNMATEYLVPAGTTYVEGTAHIVPDTGTPNVRVGARVWHDAGTIHFVLPAHVDNGGSYTPPSIEFDLKISPSATGVLSLKFQHYSVTANAIIVGDLVTTCEPNPKPYTIGVTMVDAP